MNDDFHCNRLCIIGVGLIGGSLARALRAAGKVDEVVGCSRNEIHLTRAQSLGVIDRFMLDPARAVEGADIVVLATPVSRTAEIYQAIAPHLLDDAVVSDVGSTKGSVIAGIRQALDHVPVRFVPAHPIAGTEKSGVEASFSELFIERRVILTPLDDTDPLAIERVANMWKAAGAVITRMTAEHHDEVLAATSHLPHLLAYGLVDTLATMEERREIFSYAAGGFRDFTRIASSSPDMWADIVFANRDALLPVMGRFLEDMDLLRKAVEQGDRQRVIDIFSRAKSERDRFAALVGRFAKPGDLE